MIRRIREFLKKGSPQIASVDANDVIREAIELSRNEIAKRGIQLQTRLPLDLPGVRGDRIQLQQVILNLILNAGRGHGGYARTEGIIRRLRNVKRR